MWQSKLFAVFGKISVCIWDRGRPKVDWWQFSAIASQLAAQWPRHSVSSECLCKPQIPPRLTFVPMWHIMLLTFSSRGGEHGGAWQAKKASKRPTTVWLRMVIFRLFLWQPKPAFSFFSFFSQKGGPPQAVFMATKPGVFRETWGHFQPFKWPQIRKQVGRFKPNYDVFLST